MVTDDNYTYCGEHRVIYRTVESLHCTLKINAPLYVNYTSIEKTIKKKTVGSLIAGTLSQFVSQQLANYLAYNRHSILLNAHKH